MRFHTSCLALWLILATLLTVLIPDDGSLLARVVVGAVGSLALVLGAWAAPASYRSDARLFQTTGSPAWERTKTMQLLGGALVTAGLTAVTDLSVGVAVMLGILAALVGGALDSADPSKESHRRAE